ncbi:MAG: hypothetical protein ACP5M8_07920, partial [Caldisphaera sp.]
FGGSTLYSSDKSRTITSSIPIPINTVKPVVYMYNHYSQTSLPAGTPIIVEVTTTNGVQATYQLTWP